MAGAWAVVLVIAGYGLNYYTLSAAQRPFFAQGTNSSAPAAALASTSACSAVLMFFLIYLYPLRKKKWGWLGRMGNSRQLA